MPVAKAAVSDPRLGAVRFLMKDGSKPVSVLVSSPALENVDVPAPVPEAYFDVFKLYRKYFERIASQKFDKGFVEQDGTVCIRAMDVPSASDN